MIDLRAYHAAHPSRASGWRSGTPKDGEREPLHVELVALHVELVALHIELVDMHGELVAQNVEW